MSCQWFERAPGTLFDLDAVCSAGGEPVDDVLQAITAEPRLVNVGRGDVPASKGAFALKALAPPQADRFGRESRCHELGLSVGVGLDVSTVRCDDDKPRMRALV